MPTIKDKLHFNLGGVSSKDFGLLHIVTDSGMFDEALGASRELNETNIRGNNKPLLHSVEESPLEFEMTIGFEEGYTDSLLSTVVQWLFVKYYRPLYFEEAEDKIYMAMIIGSPRIIHNGLNQGYFTVTVRCDSSNVYSPEIITPVNNVVTTKDILIVSDSHVDVYPEISIKKIGIGSITIESLDDNNKIFQVNDLTNMEDIYIDCKREIIQSDIPGIYRYDKIIGSYPRILNGYNVFRVTGDCEIQIKYKNKYWF